MSRVGIKFARRIIQSESSQLKNVTIAVILYDFIDFIYLFILLIPFIDIIINSIELN